MVQLLHPYMTTGKTIALTKWTFVGKIMSLLLIYCLGFLQIEEKRTKEAVRVIPEAKSSHSTVLHGHRDRTMTEFHELGIHSTETRLKTETAVHRSVSGHLCGGVQTPGKRCAEESDRDRTPGSPSNSEISWRAHIRRSCHYPDLAQPCNCCVTYAPSLSLTFFIWENKGEP